MEEKKRQRESVTLYGLQSSRKPRHMARQITSLGQSPGEWLTKIVA